VLGSVDAVMVTKVMGADHLRLLDEFVGELEAARQLPQGRIGLIALIETAAATQRMAEICQAGGRLWAVGLGGEDIARECGFRAGAETLLPLKQQLVYAAFAGGVTPMGFLASVADQSDAATFAAMVARSREFGFRMATCLNQDQVAVVNALYGSAGANAR
jgi:citrate lyase subunit beta/citryl-CoA lyase